MKTLVSMVFFAVVASGMVVASGAVAMAGKNTGSGPVDGGVAKPCKVCDPGWFSSSCDAVKPGKAGTDFCEVYVFRFGITKCADKGDACTVGNAGQGSGGIVMQ